MKYLFFVLTVTSNLLATTTYQTDGYGRITSADYGGGKTSTAVHDLSGNITSINSQSPGTPANPYDQDGDGMRDRFERNYFPSLAAGQAGVDSDGDGLLNLVEFALGTNPTTGTPGALALTPAANGLRLAFTRNPQSTTLTLTVEALQASSGTWQPLTTSLNGSPFGPIASGTPFQVTESTGTSESLPVQILQTASQGSYSSLRLRVAGSSGTGVTANLLPPISDQPLQPVIASFQINGGASQTPTSSVTLAIAHDTSNGQPSPTQYRLAENADISTASWQTYQPGSISYTLNGGAGTKTLSLQTRYIATESIATQASIFYNPNTPPSFAGYTVEAVRNTQMRLAVAKLLARATDADGDTISLTAVSTNTTAGGLAALSGTTITYNPPLNGTGVDSFTITLQDNRGASTVATLNINIVVGSGQGRNATEFRLVNNNNAAQLGFAGVPGRNYLIQRSTDLVTWETIATVIGNTQGNVAYTDLQLPTNRAYYRAIQAPGQ